MCLGVLSLINDSFDSSSEGSPAEGISPSAKGVQSVCCSPASDFQAEWDDVFSTPYHHQPRFHHREPSDKLPSYQELCAERPSLLCGGPVVGSAFFNDPALVIGSEKRFGGGPLYPACNAGAEYFRSDGLAMVGRRRGRYYDCCPQMIEAQGDTSPTDDQGQGMQHTICKICGDTASGNHFGVLSCEACKSFFRRSIRANARYACRGSRTCAIEKHTRNRCQYCRLQKCVAMGMRKEGTLWNEGMWGMSCVKCVCVW